ncbi:2228_t:CDS:2, partial [Scutellospora calospora]
MVIFDVPIFFVVFRETLECTIIMSILYGFINKIIPIETQESLTSSNNQEMTTQLQETQNNGLLQRLHRFQQRQNTSNQELRDQLKRTVLYGTVAGVMVSLVLGLLFAVVFNAITKNLQNATGELLWEALSSLLAVVLITLIAWYMIKAVFWKETLEKQIKDTTITYLKRYFSGNKWFLFFLPFTVILREALESFIFIYGSFEEKPLPIAISGSIGAISGCSGGYLIYKCSHHVPLRAFSIICIIACFFVAAGLFGISIYDLEIVTNSNQILLWNLDCCDPDTSQGWDVLKNISGWSNK